MKLDARVCTRVCLCEVGFPGLLIAPDFSRQPVNMPPLPSQLGNYPKKRPLRLGPKGFAFARTQFYKYAFLLCSLILSLDS